MIKSRIFYLTLVFLFFLSCHALFAQETIIPLSQLDITKMSYGAIGKVTTGQNLEGVPIRIAGQEFEDGVCTHAFSDMRIEANDATKFIANVGIDSKFPNSGSVVFKVYGDDQLLWKSEIKRGGEKAEYAEVDLNGHRIIDLVVTTGGDDYSCDWADWADARFIVKEGGKAPTALDLPPMKNRRSQSLNGRADYLYWLNRNVLNAEKPLWSFNYDGQPVRAQLDSWKIEKNTIELDDKRSQYKIDYIDPKTGLCVSNIIVVYSDYPAVEWTVWLQNNGETDTPVISDLLAMDSTLPKYQTLYHFKGDYCQPTSYEPTEMRLQNGAAISFAPQGGCPTDTAFPYYQLQGADGGLFLVNSWQGQWKTEFVDNGQLNVKMGQELVHCVLHPGEKIRTPMIVCLFHDCRVADDAVNIWRHWFLDHNIPRVHGELIQPVYANFSGEIFSDVNEKDTEDDLIRFTDQFFDHNVPFDYYWLDAGWYPCPVPGEDRNHWVFTGTWKFDPARFPNGLRPASDYIRKRGAKMLVWFEPERANPGTELAEEHPDFLLDGTLLNLGNPAALDWISERMGKLLDEEGIDWFRSDYNIDPLRFWRKADAQDRQGITENFYCQGYLKFWDNLLRDRPELIIDSCASGGRRNDLETLRRSLPIHKTDYNYGDLTAKQAMDHTLFRWFPYFGGVNWPADQSNIYYHRSNYALLYLGQEREIFKPGFDFDKLAAWVNEWREIAPLLYGDYYPLLPYSLRDTDWIGRQFNDPQKGEGVVQMFKRPNASFDSGTFRLKGLDVNAVYVLNDCNTGIQTEQTGADLTENGVPIALKNRPDSIIIHYWKK
ncbi:MAG: NPCBM/NEW2 domain-containing protein [Planctomycetia bacterium]|nr:NPCBM/NEW2 domain-containing protein [Planctomycetia bacterium]